MLYILTGVRGSGKTTLLEGIRCNSLGAVLQPSTTRSPRFAGESEYEFVSKWEPKRYAWEINVGDKVYGMRKSEIEKAKSEAVFTVFEPISIYTFYRYREATKVPSVVVGLDTVPDLAEQHRRVCMDPNRVMTANDFQLALTQIRDTDVCIRGNEAEILQTIRNMVKQQSSL